MRRYWYEAIPATKRKTKGKPTLPAEIGLDYYNQLFMLEDYYKDLKPDQKKKLYMENYLKEGRCPISNNIAENIVRPYTIGRKNFLFHDTVKGTEASSIIYSLVETAKANKLNIRRYLETILLYMPGNTNSPEGINELLPWSDKIHAECSKS